jgi:hypothetical protein
MDSASDLEMRHREIDSAFTAFGLAPEPFTAAVFCPACWSSAPSSAQERRDEATAHQRTWPRPAYDLHRSVENDEPDACMLADMATLTRLWSDDPSHDFAELHFARSISFFAGSLLEENAP